MHGWRLPRRSAARRARSQPHDRGGGAALTTVARASRETTFDQLRHTCRRAARRSLAPSAAVWRHRTSEGLDPPL